LVEKHERKEIQLQDLTSQTTQFYFSPLSHFFFVFSLFFSIFSTLKVCCQKPPKVIRQRFCL
jgi:hypothetical protein